MRPLPTTSEPLPRTHSTASDQTLEIGSSVPSANHRRSSSPTQSPYPWLLIASTSLAGLFCYLYLTKPVVGGPPVASEPPRQSGPAATQLKPEVAAENLPTSNPEPIAPAALPQSTGGPFEETVLRMQHVVVASGPKDEDLGRLTIEVPVAYESGTIHWSREDVVKARSLLARIGTYQSKALALRDEAVSLISEWDELMIRSIPETTLRADSPTLPENQGPGSADQAPFKSAETIQIKER